MRHMTQHHIKCYGHERSTASIYEVAQEFIKVVCVCFILKIEFGSSYSVEVSFLNGGDWQIRRQLIKRRGVVFLA